MQSLFARFRLLFLIAWWCASWLLLLTPESLAQSNEAFTLTAASLQNGQSVELDKLGWKYSPADDPRFADPQFDDHAWETIPNTAFDLDRLPNSGWQGIGWFRLRLRAEEILAKESLCLLLEQWGASEIWLDGRLLQNFGKVGTTTQTEVEFNPRKWETMSIAFALDGRSEHVLAIRHSCAALHASPKPWGRIRMGNTDEMLVRGTEAGMRLSLATMTTVIAERERRWLLSAIFIIGMGTLFGVLGLVHLLMFVFYPPQRASLWFGLFAFSFTGIQIGNFLWFQTKPGLNGTLYISFHFLLQTALYPICLLGFLYTIFGEGIGQRFWSFAVLILTGRMGAFFFPEAQFFLWANPIVLCLPTLEFLRLIFSAIRQKAAEALSVGLPLLLLMIFPLSEALMNFGVSVNEFIASYLLGIPAILLSTIAISAFLARQFARTSFHLEEQLVQVRQLSAAALEHEKVKAENERRAAELEEARQLQLSMLPKKLPDLPQLDIAAFMKTASEVGGDYYDFHLGEDGTLTIAVGDATGHGLKAGTLVSSVKSLFVSLAYHPDIPHIFERISRVLKEMKLRGLFMAMTMVKVKGHQLSLSIAGMPAALIWRAATNEVEEVAMRALPLGGMTNYQYQQREIRLAANDVVVVMSDGLPERMNAAGEMLDYEATRRAVAEVAAQSPQQIIEHLTRVGDEWAQGKAQDDDVTFVVLKVR